MFLNVLKVMGVGVSLVWCCNTTAATTVFSKQTTGRSVDTPSLPEVNRHSMPGSVKEFLQQVLPVPSMAITLSNAQRISTISTNSSGKNDADDFRQASLSPRPQKEREQELIMSSPPPPYLEIEVKHGEHTLSLFFHTADGSKEALYHCRVGLGGPGFPTPVGTYYVTHIYDEQPWWIPPKDRAWAAGERPSKKVYGGTMAPLLKKRDVKEKDKKRGLPSEDMIAGRVKLEDYGYRFHGTNAPRSIGRNQSHGCVRMLPADAKKVAELIKEHLGTTERRESENGSYVVLKCPVRLNLVK